MKQINITIGCATRIPLGIEGEHLAREVVFDCSRFVDEVGEGVAAVFHRRSCDDAALPVAVTQEGSIVRWAITNADTYIGEGLSYSSASGEAVLEWHVDGALAKSVTLTTIVMRSLTTSDAEPPEPVEYWYDKLLEEFRQGALTPEQIEEAVEAYLAEHPIEAPVDSVNGKTGAVVLNASDVHALPDTTVIPPAYDDTDIRALINGKQDAIADLASIRNGASKGATAVQTETDPTVPSWAKQPNKPTYTAAEVGALPSSTVIPDAVTESTVSGWGFTKFDGNYNSLTNKPTIPAAVTDDHINELIDEKLTPLETLADDILGVL